jgi:hypothetical protein
MNIKVAIRLCWFFFVILILVINGLAKINKSDPRPGTIQDKPYRSPFRYIIISSELRNDGLSPKDAQRSLSVLLDEKAFSEDTLKQLFKLLSKRYPDPKWLNVWVYTSLEQLGTPEERDSNPEISESDSNQELDKYHWALYIRSIDGSELYRFNPNPPATKMKTIIISGKTRHHRRKLG